MELSNNTGCPTIGCLSNVPQFKKQNCGQGTARGHKSKDKEEEEDRSGNVVTVITTATGLSSSGEGVRQTRRLQIQLDQ